MDWDLQIHFRKKAKDSYCLEAYLPNGRLEPEAKFDLECSEKDMLKGKQDLFRLFEAACWNQQQSKQHANMTELQSYRQAGNLMQELLSKGTRKLDDFLKPHVSNGLRSILLRVKNASTKTWPVIELHYACDFFLPFEILPLMDPHPDTLPTTAQEVEEMAIKLFPAANFLIRRITGPPNSRTKAAASGSPRKPQMRTYSCHENGTELVNELNAWLEKTGEIAEKTTSAERLVGSLTNGQIDIVHVLCHHSIQGDEAYLQFITPSCGASGFTMSLSEMTHAMKALLTKLPAGCDKALPLVFLHACYAGRMVEPRGSFATLMSECGSRAVITSETSVLVSHAVNFAAAFYDLHCHKGEPAGLAFHKAQILCLRGYSAPYHAKARPARPKLSNPAGLLYTYHGDLDIAGFRIEKN